MFQSQDPEAKTLAGHGSLADAFGSEVRLFREFLQFFHQFVVESRFVEFAKPFDEVRICDVLLREQKMVPRLIKIHTAKTDPGMMEFHLWIFREIIIMKRGNEIVVQGDVDDFRR